MPTIAVVRPPTLRDVAVAAAVGHDRVALGCYEAPARRGLPCPDDVSVIGVNDMTFMDKTQPTRVRVAHHEIGAEVARLLLETFQEPQHPPRAVLLRPAPVARSSTAPPA